MDMMRIKGLLGGMMGNQMPQMQPSQAPLGSGMAAQAAQILQSRPYQLYVQEAQAMGQQPLPPEQWMQMMQQQGQQAQGGGLLGQ